MEFSLLFQLLYEMFFSLYSIVQPVFDFLNFGVVFPWQGSVISINVQSLLFGAGIIWFFAVSIFKWLPG